MKKVQIRASVRECRVYLREGEAPIPGGIAGVTTELTVGPEVVFDELVPREEIGHVIPIVDRRVDALKTEPRPGPRVGGLGITAINTIIRPVVSGIDLATKKNTAVRCPSLNAAVCRLLASWAAKEVGRIKRLSISQSKLFRLVFMFSLFMAKV
jgi:hypothetical protein